MRCMTRRRRRLVHWTILITAALTVLGVTIAMNFATPEKKLERKIEHRYAIADPQFRREMSVLLGPSIVAGNQVRDLQNGDEIFPAMLAAIRAAQKTIDFETYIYWSGDIGRQFADALSERAKAGVAVKVVIDWAGSIKIEDALLEQLRQAGVEVRMYRPLKWYNLGRLNNRTHRKLLVVDGTVGFTGGVGIADQWEGHAQDAGHWRDVHFQIEGPVVAQIQAAFNDNWIKITGEVLNGGDYFPPQASAGDMDAQMFIASPAGGSESMHLMYLMAIAAAGTSIDLEASYFVPDDLVLAALLAARKREVRVRILLPGKHRLGDRPHRLKGSLGAAARGGGRDLRVPAHDDAQQGVDRGSGDGVGGLDELRPALFPTQRRGQSERVRPRIRRADVGRLRGRSQGDATLHARDVAGAPAKGALRREGHPAHPLAALSPSLVVRRIRNPCCGESFPAQPTRVTAPACPALLVCLVAGHRDRIVHAQGPSQADDVGLAQLDQRCADKERLEPFGPGTRRQVRHALEGGDVLRTAVRIAGVVDCIHADKDIVRAEHFAPREREGQEHRVARRHIGDRNTLDRRLGHWNRRIGERRPAEGPEVDVYHPVLDGTEHLRDARGRIELGRVPLPVREAERMTGIALGPRDCQAGRGIKTTRDEHHRTSRIAASRHQALRVRRAKFGQAGLSEPIFRVTAQVPRPRASCEAEPAGARRGGPPESIRRARAARVARSWARRAPGRAALWHACARALAPIRSRTASRSRS